MCFSQEQIKKIQMQRSFQELIKSTVPKIICVGKNYLQHVKEMGAANVPQKPVIFLKPWSSLIYNPQSLSLPIATQHQIDHQLQLGVYINKAGNNISKQSARNYVGGYFLALDLTDRDLQKEAKAKGFPWQLSKGQDNFCPVTDLFQEKIDPYAVQLHMKVNNQTKQKDMTSSMHFKIEQVISFVSRHMTLSEGDLILTGTPAGVGPLKHGDKVFATAKVHDKIVGKFDFQVTK